MPTLNINNDVVLFPSAFVGISTSNPYSGMSTKLYVGYPQDSTVNNADQFISVGAGGGSTNKAGINFLIYSAGYGGRIYTDDAVVRGLAFDVLQVGTFYNAMNITRTTSPNVLIGTTTDNGRKLNVNGDIFSSGEIYSNQYAAGRYIRYNWNTTNFAVGASTGTRWVIGRIYWNQVHWGTYSGMDIEIVWNYYNGARKKYSITNGANGGTVYLRESQSYASTYARVSLGSAVDTGTTSGGYPNYYQDVYLDVNEYNQVSVNGELKGSQISIDKTSIGGSEYGWATFFSSPSASNISTFTSTAATILSSEGNWGYIDNKLGINVANPAVQLEIYNAGGPELKLSAGGSGTGGLRIIKGDSGTAYINNNDAVGMNFQIQGSDKMAIAANGNVLIGTTTDSGYKLAVNGKAVFGIGQSLEIGNAAANPTDAGISYGMFHQSGVGLGIVSGAGGSTQGIAIWSNDGTNFFQSVRISGATGNVGIGTTSPIAKLHISSSGTPLAAAIQGDSKLVVSGVDGNMDLLSSDDNSTVANSIGFGRFNASTGALIHKFGITSWANTGSTGSNTGDRIAFNYGTLADAWGNSELMTIKASGNVGIGTTNPNKQLTFAHVNDDAIQIRRQTTSQGTTSLGTGISWTWTSAGTDNETWAAIRVIMPGNSNSNMTFSTTPTGGAANLSERMRIADNGNVGIGTTNPLGITNNSGLQIDRGGHTTIMIGNGTTTGGVVQSSDDTRRVFIGANIYDDVSGSWSQFDGNAGYAAFDAIGGDTIGLARILVGNPGDSGYASSNIFFEAYKSDATSYVKMRTATDNVLYLTNGGNVGIGNTNPGYKLEVSGTSYFSGLAHFGQTATSGSAFRWGSYGTAVSSDTMLCMNQLWNGSGWTILNSGVGTTYLNLGGDVASPTIQFGTGPANTAATTKMIILNNGDVGIGTTSPSFSLSVDRATTATAQFNTNGNMVASFRSSTVSANAWAGLKLMGDEGSGIWFSDEGGTYNHGYISQRYTGQLDFATGTDSTAAATVKMTILSGGNVGIGTTAPAAILHVSSTGANAYSSTITKGSNMKGIVNTLSNNADDMVGIYFATGTNDAGSHWSGITGSRSQSATDWSTQLNFYTHDENLSNINDATQKMVIKGSGNVGIGTTSPTLGLHVADAKGFIIGPTTYSGSTYISPQDENTINGGYGINADDADIWLNYRGYQDGWSYFRDTRIGNGKGTAITYWNGDTGNMIIGSTTDAGYKLDVHGEILGRDDIRILNTYALVLNGTDNNWRIGRNTISDSGWLTSNTMQMVVFGSSSGQGFQVVNHNGTALFEIDGVAGASRFTNALGVGVNPSGTAGRIDASNDIVAYQTSDRRLKENITPIANALDKVKSLTGVEFDWKEETKDVHGYEGHDVGIIAQEVQAVMPTAVRTNDTGYLSVRYEKMIALLVEANKELASRIEELEKKLK